MNVEDEDQLLPSDFQEKNEEDKISWLNEICCRIVKKYMFENKEDMFEQLWSVLDDPDHIENYFVASDNDDRFHCHFCPQSFVQLNSVKLHEKLLHQYTVTSKTYLGKVIRRMRISSTTTLC